MKIIVPMAGRGSRLRPHTLTVPKPLIPIAGKPIVQRLVEDIVSVCGDKKVTEIAFIIGDFGAEVEADLVKVAENLGAKGSMVLHDGIIYRQQAIPVRHVLDTTGAGDAFLASFIANFYKYNRVGPAVLQANKYASKIVEKLGSY